MKKWVVANWKMNGSRELLNNYNRSFKGAEKMIVCPPFTYLCADSVVNFGAQNVHCSPNGAYTGEISASMLAEKGIKYCIVGHSERRQYFNETNDLIKLKASSCISSGITPIICIGETLKEYTSQQTNKVLEKQLQECIPSENGAWIAYEPLWAIGTGKTPTMAEITLVHSMLRQQLPEIVLLYGGSVNPTNVTDIFAIPNVDGVLVGGASLNMEAITAIYLAAIDK